MAADSERKRAREGGPLSGKSEVAWAEGRAVGDVEARRQSRQRESRSSEERRSNMRGRSSRSTVSDFAAAAQDCVYIK